jgi:pyridoxamine 5'-phosphate oxidase
MPRRPDMPPLRRSDLRDDPIEQFAEWYAGAAAEVPLADAVCLATVDADGSPDARMVLLKGVDAAGFRFHTNYSSAKGEQLAADGRAALVVYWRELDRQVRVRGTVERLPAAESDAYFATRPRESQLAAWASPQSRPLRDRAELDGLVAESGRRFEGGPVPRPEGWGGYLLRPEAIEFWQGQVDRVHDRFRYVRDGRCWRIERLAP